MNISIKELKALVELIQGNDKTNEPDVKADESWNNGIKSITFVAEEEEEESFDVIQFLKENREQHEYDIALYPYNCSLECYKYSDIVFLESMSECDVLNIFPCLVNKIEVFVLFTPNAITTKIEFESILSIAKKTNNEAN